MQVGGAAAPVANDEDRRLVNPRGFDIRAEAQALQAGQRQHGGAGPQNAQQPRPAARRYFGQVTCHAHQDERMDETE